MKRCLQQARVIKTWMISRGICKKRASGVPGCPQEPHLRKRTHFSSGVKQDAPNTSQFLFSSFISTVSKAVQELRDVGKTAEGSSIAHSLHEENKCKPLGYARNIRIVFLHCKIAQDFDSIVSNPSETMLSNQCKRPRKDSDCFKLT